MTCQNVTYCSGCGEPLRHHEATPTDPRLEGLAPWEIGATDILRAVAAIRDHGPMSAIDLRRRLGGRRVVYGIHLLLRVGCVEKLPAPTSERWPLYRWVEP